MDREPEPWQTNAPGPVLTIGVDARSCARNLGAEEVEGFAEARQRARDIAAPSESAPDSPPA